MENEVMNSCLMLTVNLDTPVDLGCIFEAEDLKETGIELDSHVTLLYAQGKKIERENLLNQIIEILGSNEYSILQDEYMKADPGSFNVFDFFELGSFENDSDYVILKLKKDTQIFEYLRKINSGVSEIFGVKSEFKDYTPHMTLAELNSESASKYMDSEALYAVLRDSVFDFEDLMISYGTDNEPEDRKQYFLTQNKCIDRYFRLKNLKELHDELMNS